MKISSPSTKLLAAVALCAAAFGSPAAEKSEALRAPVAVRSWVATHTRAHALAYADATDTGAMAESESVHIAVALKLRNKDALDALTQRLASGQSAQVLTSQQFLERHAPSREQAVRVVNYLRSHGFQNVAMADNRMLVTADGTPGQIRAAFRAEMRHFDVRGRRAFANVTDADVPDTLADTVLAVTGLQTVHMARTMSRRAEPQAVSPQAVVGVSPPLFAGIYGASGMPSASTATIGIITQGSMTQTVADLKTFAANAGYPVPPVSVVTVGSASSDTSGVDEWNMDTQTSLAAAGGTIHSMLLYTATTLSDANLTTTYNKAVSDNLAKVINVSLGECETAAKSSGIEASNDQIFQTAVAQGQTFSVSSGDSGSYECGGSTSQQSYPAVSPYVMSLGGTTLSSSGGTWVGETVWSCTTSRNCATAGGTGGGVSSTEAAPSWQTAAGVLTTAGKRGVPDIAFDASPNSGALVLVNGSNVQIGGTSLSAPLFTGFYSRIQAAHGNTLGFPAQTLYAGAAANPSWFHDVTSGSNGGYSAGTGWDYVTGYGSLQVQNFSAAFGGGSSTLTAAFSCSTSGLTANCTDSSTDSGGTIGGHAWTFGDGGTSTATNPSHAYAAAGTYTVTETVTESGTGKTASASHTVTVTSGSGSSQLLLNTGFESGATSWTMTSGVACTNATCSGETAHGGTGFAWLDGYGSTHTDTVAQGVAIPAGKASATLAFYLHVDTRETTKTVAYDKLTVQVLNSSGAVLATVATYSNLNAATGYTLRSLSLAPYIGQTVTIKFTGSEDSSLATSFVLDDVTLTVQ